MTVLKELDKKKLALGVTDAPSTHTYVDTLMKPIAGALDMDLDATYISSTGANYNVTAATELSGDPDVTGIIALPEDGCTALFQALRQQGYQGTIFAGSCSQFIDAMGPDAAGAIVQPRLWVPLSKDSAPAEVQKELDEFATAMDEVGYGDELSARSLYSFAVVMNLVKVLSGIDGDITSETVTTAMEGLKDFQTFAGPQVTCDGKQWPGYPSSCSHEAIFFQVGEDGKLTPVYDEGYTELDPSLVPAA
jgi:branched-chain amino acid transport system substrate-binding protein